MEDVVVEVTNWRSHSVLVTGAAGLLGSSLVAELVAQGANVTCLIRDWVPRSMLVTSGLLDRTNVVRGELEDHSLLLRLLNEYEVDSVFHLGAQTIVGTAARSALSTFEANVRGTWNLLEACKECASLVRRVVVASSDKAYGAQASLPYTEGMPLLGRFPYDVSKACAEMIALSYHYTYQLPVAITRCGNLFGGGDLNFNRLVPGTIRSVLMDEPPLIRSNGRMVRDYFYVRDAVEAYLQLAAMLPGDRFVGQAFNFGYETPVAVLEMVELILDVANVAHLRPIVLDQASNEIEKQYLDCGKAREMLGWRPRFTLREGLQQTVEWYRDALPSDPAHPPSASAHRSRGSSALASGA